MPFYEREEKILRLLVTGEGLSLETLAKELFVSRSTLRRDLIKLEDKGYLIRTHGSYKLVHAAADEKIPFLRRLDERDKAKALIAEKAAGYVSDGMVLMLDGSTTAFALVPQLAAFKNLIVLTSSAKTSLALGGAGIKNICTGGSMINRSFSYVGTDALRTIRSYNADLCFFSCRGITQSGYACDNSAEENEIRLAMCEQSQKRILLCDSSKFGVSCLQNLRHISAFDAVLSDAPLPKDYISPEKS